MSSFIVPAIILVVVFAVVMFLATKASGKETARDRLERMTPSFDGSPYDQAYNPDTSFLERDQKSAMAALGESLIGLTGRNIDETRAQMEWKMMQAGIESPNAVGHYYLWYVTGMPLLLLVGYWILTQPIVGMMKMVYMIVGLVAILLAVFGPKIYVKNLKDRRQFILQRSFPDTLDLILVCVESGLALDAALARVCRELGRAHPMITQELNRTRMELTLLSDREQALQNLADRTDLMAFRSLVAALMQTEKFGTSLTETLRVLSDDYRHARLMAAENKAGRLPALMTIPLITLLLPALFLIILGPAFIQFTAIWGEKMN